MLCSLETMVARVVIDAATVRPAGAIASGGHLVVRPGPLASGPATRQNRRMLLGRKEERLALDRLLAEARDGHSGVLALVGEPGIGKTALLEHAAESAGGMRVLRARGIESEAEIPFAGLAELLRPALSALDRIPAPQATALAGALALGPARPRDRFAIGAATLSLLSAYAEEAPLALLVDDAHLLDGSSAEALLFAARRLRRRSDRARADRARGRAVAAGRRRPPRLPIAGLDRSDAAELCPRPRCRATPSSVCIGPPAAIRSHCSSSAPDAGPPRDACQAMGRADLDEHRRRVRASLRAATRADPAHVSVLVAASDAGDLARRRREPPSTRALTSTTSSAAEEAGLVTLDGVAVQFAHPLARSALYARASVTGAPRGARGARGGAARSRRRSPRLAPRGSERRPRRREPPSRSSRPERERGHGARTPSPLRRSSGRPARAGGRPAGRCCSRLRRPHGSPAMQAGRSRCSTTTARRAAEPWRSAPGSTTCAARWRCDAGRSWTATR